MEKQKPTTAELTIMIAGAVMLIGSFVSFYSGGSSSAWSSGLFPVATLMPLYGVIMGGEIVVTKFAGSSFPIGSRPSPGSRSTWCSPSSWP